MGGYVMIRADISNKVHEATIKGGTEVEVDGAFIYFHTLIRSGKLVILNGLEFYVPNASQSLPLSIITPQQVIINQEIGEDSINYFFEFSSMLGSRVCIVKSNDPNKILIEE